jgi:Amt family ammonium transporter
MTTMGGCSGGVTALLYGLCPEKFGGVGYPSLEYSINGVLSGMVAVCGCCAVVPIWSVFWFISPIAVASFFINMKINEKLKVDDPLGASALHYGPGVVGVIMVGLFGTDDLTSNAYGYTYGEWRDHGAKEDYIGIFMGGNGTQLGYQIAAIAIYSAYGLVTCGILFYGMKMCGILRVPEEDEKIGLDASHHGGPAYILSSDELDAVTTKGVEVTSP